MNIIDIIFLVPLAIYLILGYRKGAIVEIMTVVAFILAIIFSIKFTNIIVDKLGFASTGRLLPYLAYLVVFIVVYFLINWVGKLLEKALKIAQLNWINNLFGALVGAFKIIFFFSLLIWITDQTGFLPDTYKETSISYHYIKPIAPRIINVVVQNIPALQDILTHIESFFDELIRNSSQIQGMQA